MMDDTVLREVTVLIRDCGAMSRTLICLRRALRDDLRFAKVMSPTGDVRQSEMFEGQKQTGPEGQTSLDPFSVPLGGVEDYD